MNLYAKQIVRFSLFLNMLSFANMPPHGFSQFLNKYFVETGTYDGRGIEHALNAGFKIIHSIEIDKNMMQKAYKKFQENNFVHIWYGDSGSILYDIIKALDEPITFWLDGHNGSYNPYGENTPLMHELNQIKQHHIKTHTLLIDDMHCAGKELFDFITQDMIMAKIKEINPAYEITYIAGGDQAEYPNNIMVAQVSKH